MPETLYADMRNNDEPIAMPAFEIGLILDGMLNDLGVERVALAIFDEFINHFQDQLVFKMRESWTSKSAKLTAFKPKDILPLRQILAGGAPKTRCIRLYGTDENELNLPFTPFFSIDHDAYPMTRIVILLPPSAKDLRAFSDRIDQLARESQLRFGVQGFAFMRSPLSGFQDLDLPPAYNRYRAALMGNWFEALPSLFHSEALVEMQRLEQTRRKDAGKPWDYHPGIVDIGWRTYIGKRFADRLQHSKPPADTAVKLEANDHMNIVTIGDEPIWGDINGPEDISAWRAAHDYLRPAFASREVLKLHTWDMQPSSPKSIEKTEGYLNRLARR